MTLSQLNRPVATLTLNAAAQRTKIEKAAGSKSMNGNDGDGKQHTKPHKKLAQDFGDAMQKALSNGAKKPSENPEEKAKLKQQLHHSSQLARMAMEYKLKGK